MYALSTDGIDITTNKDGTFDVKMNQQGKYNFGQIQTDQSLKGNIASTQKTDRQGNIIMAPNNTPMIVGPISVNTFGASSPTIISDTQRQANKKAADKRKAEADKFKGTIPSSASKSKGGQKARIEREDIEAATRALKSSGKLDVSEKGLMSFFFGRGIQSKKPGLAKGGPAKEGKEYIVGEEGPEMFIPQVDGNVIDNDDTKVVNMLLESNPQLKNISRARAVKILKNRFPDYF